MRNYKKKKNFSLKYFMHLIKYIQSSELLSSSSSPNPKSFENIETLWFLCLFSKQAEKIFKIIKN